MRSLSKLCEIELVRNHKMLDNTSNIPYRLLSNVLKQMKKDQLNKVEKCNVLLIFEDDDIWLQFLKSDFPSSVSDSYTSKRETIRDYYLDFIKLNDPQMLIYDRELIDTYLGRCIRKDPLRNKYKIPYRVLYSNYEQDEIRKAEQSTERLRSKMREIQKERESKQSVTVDYSFYSKNNPTKKNNKFSNNSNHNKHSELFKKSLKEHQTRLKYFKDGGFDIAKKHTNRVAFGGSAGGSSGVSLKPNNNTVATLAAENSHPHEITVTKDIIDLKPTIPLEQVVPAKRRSRVTNIFLTKKKPSIIISPKKKIEITQCQSSVSNLTVPQGHAKEQAYHVGRITKPKGKKKVSGIFSTSIENRIMSSVKNTKVYIHNKPKENH